VWATTIAQAMVKMEHLAQVKAAAPAAPKMRVQ
jgi:hypothetical protein